MSKNRRRLSLLSFALPPHSSDFLSVVMRNIFVRYFEATQFQ